MFDIQKHSISVFRLESLLENSLDYSYAEISKNILKIHLQLERILLTYACFDDIIFIKNSRELSR